MEYSNLLLKALPALRIGGSATKDQFWWASFGGWFSPILSNPKKQSLSSKLLEE